MARRNRKSVRKATRKSSSCSVATASPTANANIQESSHNQGGDNSLESCLSADVYLAERGKLIDIEQEGYNQHDKAILTLTAGALALSIAFLRVISASSPVSPYLLLTSWIFLGIAIIATLTSFFTSQRACRHQRKLLDQEYETGKIPAQVNSWTDATLWLNTISCISFVFGAGFLVCFTWLNIPEPSSGKSYDHLPEQKQLETQIDSTRLKGDSR